MDFRTGFPIEKARNKIDYNTPVMFVGSCFASEIGNRMDESKFDVCINPYGNVYNPASVADTINSIIENRYFTEKDLYLYNGVNLSFSHYTNFSSTDGGIALDKINSSCSSANKFLKKARFLFITFGTSGIYRFKETGRVVSNCHKLPSSFFSREILSVEEIVSEWELVLEKLHFFNKDLRIIFTVSPVRYWDDGPHANNISKSILFLAIEELLHKNYVEGYFPAYELLMDDLRDYRFYADDMLHPSHMAIDYIWKAFSECYFSKETISISKEIFGISKAMKHRFHSESEEGRKAFAATMLKKIAAVQNRNPQLNLITENSYFHQLFSK
jgi:hypothetical protein